MHRPQPARPAGRDARNSPLTLPLIVIALAVLTTLAATSPAAATEGGSGYRTPPAAMTALIDAPLSPRTMVSPGQAWLLVLEPRNLSSIAELAEPELRLAGMRINPRLDAPSRDRPWVGMTPIRLADGARPPVRGLSAGARFDNVTFAPGGRHVAFTVIEEERIALWTLELATGEARPVADVAIHLAAQIAPAWLDESRLVAAVVPAGRGAAPAAPRVPSGPVIQENTGTKSPARTYQDLLASPHDEALFAHHLEAQIAIIGLDGSVRRLGDPAMLWNLAPSPDGRFLLVESLHRPFSYLVPAWRFPRRIEVLDADGKRRRLIADLPLQESVPTAFGSVPTGPRQAQWRADAPATLVWVEALDGGDAGAELDENEPRDRLFLLAAPFDGAPRPWAALRDRLGDIEWSSDDLALATTWWWKTRMRRVERLRPGTPEAPAETVIEGSWEDRYADPGAPVTVLDARAHEVLATGPEPGHIYFIGDGASPEGDRPFLDCVDVATGESERLFRSEAPFYEEPLLPLDPAAENGATRLLVRRESLDDPPNIFVRKLDASGDRDPLEKLTDLPHPAPALRGVSKELIRYRRDDGVELTGTLYLPPGYQPEQGPLPLLMWAYPQEFKSADHAGQVTDSPHRFTRFDWRSPALWLAAGYAVLDDPSMPIVGEGDAEPNDTFRAQLVASAKAAVDEVVRRGVAKPGHIAIGGHSYGAFMTANLLAHSDLFAAGIARSGAYNRTLTPFGFQAEERTFWQAPEVYFAMSPFMHVDKVNEPILLIHGAADNNSGTFPIQSERFYAALKGHGATARLVMLPHESHGYRARESILHMLWESHEWLERYVRRDLATTPELSAPEAARGGS